MSEFPEPSADVRTRAQLALVSGFVDNACRDGNTIWVADDETNSLYHMDLSLKVLGVSHYEKGAPPILWFECVGGDDHPFVSDTNTQKTYEMDREGNIIREEMWKEKVKTDE